MRTSRIRPPLIAIALAGLAAGPAAAQDVQYKSTTKLDFGGAMNAMLKLAGAQEVSETAYLKDKKMRSDIEKQTTIFDLDAGRYIIIDHAAKTFISVPIGQMAQAAAAMMTQAKVEANQTQAQGTIVGEKGDKVDFDSKLKFEPTNEKQKINGADSERSFMTMETDLKYTAEGETKAEDAGTIVLFVDTWSANSGPAHEAIQRFYQAAGEQVAKNVGRPGMGLEGAFASPEMAAAMRKAAEEQQKMQGLPMRSTIHFVAVPPGVPFNRDLVLNAEKEKGSGAAGAAKSAARGMLGGMLGGKKQQEPPKEDPETPQQAPIMKMIMEIRDVQVKSLPASLFEIPAGYREIPVGTGGAN